MVSRHTVTLANSIVGVSVLAMPFCFKQCGIVLATLSLMIGAIMTRMVCYFLLKAAVMSRRRTYEMLAWSTFGHTGKLMVEISIIGYLIGTLIAFMVVIGDLGPEILSEIFSVENNSSLRTIIMTALSLFVALPLGLLRNIDSLASVSTASVLFYVFLLLKIFSEGVGPLWSGEYLERIHFWRSGGVLQCIPIFSMALSCQTQIFGIYDTLAEPSLQKMNEIVKDAVNICTFFYFCVGFFGYIAFSQQNFGGNILLSFSPEWSTQLIKSMFLMSVVFSIPLVIFPCRVSLHSMIFKSGSTYHQVHDMSTNYIPESRLKFLTVTIVACTLVIGILIPNIELVLGLVGSTTGSVICIIFPSIMFVRVTSKSTTERLLAQSMFCIGVVLMLLTTYATLYAAEQSQMSEKIPEPLRVTESDILLKPILNSEIVQLKSPLSKSEEGKIERNNNGVEFQRKVPERKEKLPVARLRTSSQPVPSVKLKEVSPAAEVVHSNSKPVVEPRIKEVPKVEETKRFSESAKVPEKSPDLPRQEKADDTVAKADNKQQGLQVPVKEENVKPQSEVEGNKKEFVDKQAAEAFLKKLEEHQQNQKKLLEEQKEILEELKQHHAQDVREKIEKEIVNEESMAQNKKREDEIVPKLAAPSVNAGVGAKVPADDQAKKVIADHPAAADKIIQEQEKIIEKISENIAKEDKNAQLLEKLEEGLNKEVQKMDTQTKDNEQVKPPVVPQTVPKVENVKRESEGPHPPLIQPQQAAPQNNNLPPNHPQNINNGNVDIARGVLVGSLGSNLDSPKVPESVSRSNPVEDIKIQPSIDGIKQSNSKASKSPPSPKPETILKKTANGAVEKEGRKAEIKKEKEVKKPEDNIAEAKIDREM